MKTKTIIFGMVIAALSALSLSQSKAQTLSQPAIAVIPTIQKDVIKVIYDNGDQESVEIKFMDSNGFILRDRIKANSFEGGFAKKYKVQRRKSDEFWIEVRNSEMSVTYKMVADANGKWLAQLEEYTQHRIVASK